MGCTDACSEVVETFAEGVSEGPVAAGEGIVCMVGLNHAGFG
jgi:hypothetical protein